MTGVTGIHHVQVAAPPACEEAAREFYGRLLGLEEIEKPPLLAVRGGCWFALGDGELHVGVEDPFRSRGSAGSTRATRGATGSSSSPPFPPKARLVGLLG